MSLATKSHAITCFSKVVHEAESAFANLAVVGVCTVAYGE